MRDLPRAPIPDKTDSRCRNLLFKVTDFYSPLTPPARDKVETRRRFLKSSLQKIGLPGINHIGIKLLA
jgi:hypothetical protein